MPQLSGCYRQDELERYAAGRLSSAEAEAIANHLQTCDACWSVVRARKPEPATRDPRSDGDATPSGAANIGGMTVDLGSTRSLFAFLSPPQDGGELGRLGSYRVLRLLGRGGMGMVFEAEDTHLQRRVALKVMLPELAADPQARDRFLREARTMAAVTHENIVTVYQVGLAAGSSGQEDVPFLAMQLLSGETLEDRLARAGRLPVGEAVRIGRQVAEGLAAAHAQGLIHRDIKPANIFLEGAAAPPASLPPGERDAAGSGTRSGTGSGVRGGVRVKVLDFGLARWAESRGDLSRSGQIIGTPYYMAPEQGAGEPVDTRADLFSLGCVLYVMLAGQRPFDGQSTMAVLTALATQEPRPLTQAAPDVPPELANLVHHLLVKDPARRPQYALDVAEALAVMEPRGPSDVSRLRAAPRPRLFSRPRRWPRWLLLAGALAALLLVIVGIGVLEHLLGGAGQPAASSAQQPEPPAAPAGEPIKVGILHSLTGTMRDSEWPVVEMTRLTLDDLNKKGGLLGRPVEYVVADGQSNESVFAREALRLINQDKVNVIFGCWTSASRKAVKKVVEDRNHLLIYPVQHEGLEQSANIVYTGAAPNQQLLPAIDWCLRKGYRKFFLVGSDYVFPQAANAIMKDRILREPGAEVVGEEYLLLGAGDARPVVEKIAAARPDVILNTINGSTNLSFFQALRNLNITPQQTPTISFSLDEASLKSLDARLVAGHYLAWNYFGSITGEVNAAFVKRFRDYYGDFRVVTDPMEAAYLGVQLWAQAVTLAGTPDVTTVRQAILGQRFNAPEGPEVQVDPDTQYTWKYFRLGRITDDGRITILLSHDTPTCPQPFPPTRKREEWTQLLDDMYKRWGNRWSNPGN